MIQTASEIKAQILRDSAIKPNAKQPAKDRAAAIELGNSVKRMTSTSGWKIVESWIMHQLDVGKILEAPPDKLPLVHAKAQAYSEIIKQVHYWITMAELLEEQINKEKVKE